MTSDKSLYSSARFAVVRFRRVETKIWTQKQAEDFIAQYEAVGIAELILILEDEADFDVLDDAYTLKSVEKWIKRVKIDKALKNVRKIIEKGDKELARSVLSGVRKAVEDILTGLGRVVFARDFVPVKKGKKGKSRVVAARAAGSLPDRKGKAILYLSFGGCRNTGVMKSKFTPEIEKIVAKIYESEVGEVDFDDTCWFEVVVDDVGEFSDKLRGSSIGRFLVFWKEIKEGQGATLARIRHKTSDVDGYEAEKAEKKKKKAPGFLATVKEGTLSRRLRECLGKQ